jgi:hypothetical protein
MFLFFFCRSFKSDVVLFLKELSLQMAHSLRHKKWFIRSYWKHKQNVLKLFVQMWRGTFFRISLPLLS